MNAGSAATGEAALVFDWDRPRSRKLAVLGFLAGSVVLHAICFYLFRIVYPPAVVLLPPPARVSLITAASEEGRSLLRWVDAEDPALAAATQRPPDARQRPLPKVQHVPSYVAQQPQLKPAPPLTTEPRAHSIYPPGPAPLPRPSPPPAAGPVPTRLRFSEELTALGQPQVPPPGFRAAGNESPTAARFRIAVDPAGVVRFCFPVDSSGDLALDEQARRHVLLSRFPARVPNDRAPLTWGSATVEWGSDIIPPQTAEPTAPPAP